MDNDFIKAFNNKQDNSISDDMVRKPFVGAPSMLPLAERQELIYRYQYLDESIEFLATHYYVTPSSLKAWLNQNDIERKELKTEEDIHDFEVHVNELYKSLQIRLLGLVALNSAKAWESLAMSEENILFGLETASKNVSEQRYPDAKTLASLASAHDKLVGRHELIVKAMDKAGDVVQALKDHLSWELEVVHVSGQAKSTRTEEVDQEQETDDAS